MSKQTSAALLLVGNTGSGKTSLIGTLAEHVFRKYGKITRLATFDPGGYGDDVVALIKVGVIQVFRGYTRDPEGALGIALETCSLVTRGYWPREIDPETGSVSPGVDMVAPRVVTFTMICPSGHPVRKAFAAQQLTPTACPTCKVMTSQANCLKILQSVQPTPGFEKIGASAFDGLTSMTEWSLDDMAGRAAKNQLGGEKAAINSLTSGGLKYGGNNRASIGFVQSRAHEWVMNSLSIPDQVVPPTFTALELRATDDRTDLPVYGPKIAGQAKTAEVPQWFGNTLGTVIYPGDKGAEWRLYLREYRMPGESAPHLCKVRTTPNTMPEFLSDQKDGEKLEPFSEFSLGKFYELAGLSLDKADERVATRLSGLVLPGLSGTLVGGAAPPIAAKVAGDEEGGEATAIAAPAPAAPAAPVVAFSGFQDAAALRAPAPAAAPPPPARRAAAPTATARRKATPPAAPGPAAGESTPTPAAPAPPAEAAAAAPAAAPAAGVIPRAQQVQPPAAAKPAAPSAPQPPPAAAVPAAVAPAPSAQARPRPVPPPAGARPAPRPPAAGPVAVGKKQ